MIFKKIMIPVALLCLAGLTFFSCNREKSKEKPNVLLIYTDDQGSIDMNCYGADDLTTPNMDNLALNGVRFTQFYAAAPVCSPSRAALLTGLTPQEAGLPGNASSSQGHGGMPTNQVTIAEIMKDAGYATGHVGKWHLGYTPETMPNGQGFDESFGHMGGCIDNYSHFFYWAGPNRHDLWKNGKEVWHDGEYFLDLMIKELEAFITKHQADPFFLYWAINMPHYPLQATEKWREHYKDLPHPRDKYAAFVSTIDEYIGMAVDVLNERNLIDNTIIIYQSDHGHSEETRTFGGGGNAGPYRGAKFSVFEGGIRVPAIISWKNRLPDDQVRDQMAVNVDWLPTIAELCNVELPEHKLAGKSLVPVIMEDADSPHEHFYWMRRNQWAARSGKWKLLNNPRDSEDKIKGDTLMLINLEEDPGEQRNLINEYPDKAEEIKTMYKEWAAGVE